MSFTDEMTLGEARDELRELVVAGGHHCPCCRQLAKVYRRKIHVTLARGLVALYRTSTPGEFVHAPSLPGDTHELSQLAWWELVQEERIQRPDGGRAGWWRITSLGIDFVCLRVRVPKYARVYDGECLSVRGEPVSIVDCLGDEFSYRELMAH